MTGPVSTSSLAQVCQALYPLLPVASSFRPMPASHLLLPSSRRLCYLPGLPPPSAVPVAPTAAKCPGFGWDRVNFLFSSWYSTLSKRDRELSTCLLPIQGTILKLACDSAWERQIFKEIPNLSFLYESSCSPSDFQRC